MAKMFYTMDETKAALGKSEDEIRQFAREGKLREFRDGPRLMFKADQVENLKGELGGGRTVGGDQVGLGAGDTHTPLGLMDSKSGSGTGVAMNLAKGDTATGMPPVQGGPSGDTGAGMDVGLSGSLSGSIGGGSLAGGSLGGTSSGTGGPGASRGGRGGVNVLGSDGDADPMAQTHITPPKDQISLEGVGSGSGLLDLTRETDDTSLGAALLDEISPGGSKRDKGGSTAGGSTAGGLRDVSGSTAGMTSISPMELPSDATPMESSYSPAPMYVETPPDPDAPAFAVTSIVACLVMLLAGFVVIGAVTTDNPLLDPRVPLVKSLDGKFLMFLVAAVVVAVIAYAITRLFAGKRVATV